MKRFGLAVLLSLLAVSCGSDSDKGTATDSTPPAAIANLAVISVSDSSLTLTWTAPGDDGSTGTATTYDIRLGTATITDTNWGTSTAVSGEPAPGAAGTTESMEVVIGSVALAAAIHEAGDMASTTYYFAIKTADEAQNWSALSNVASESLEDEIPPETIDDLAITVVGDTSVTLTWTAPGDDGTIGTAQQYDIRFRTAQITEANWDGATEVTDEPTPKAAGSTETLEVTVESGTASVTLSATQLAGFTYYLGIKTVDDEGNWSVLSNVVSTQLADLTPPAAVEDLAIASFTSSSITLGWDAPGDDGNDGTAAQYDIRYSTSQITEANWSAATPVAGLSAPQASGVTESFEITGLTPGITYYFAIKTKDENDNWSDLSNTVSGTPVNNVAVNFPDTALEAVIRSAINKPTGDIMALDLLALTSVYARNKGVVNLTGLEHCINMTTLNLQENQIVDISPLSNLSALQTIILYKNDITDLSPLSGLANLAKLHLTGNGFADVSPLAGLTALKDLNLQNNQVSDISLLSGLTNLHTLVISDNQVSSLAALAGMTNLQTLYAHTNSISDVSPLAGLTALRILWLYTNTIADISPLASLVNMEQMSIFGNPISDISAIANMTKLQRLFTWRCGFSDVSPLAGLTEMTELGLGNNNISDISSLTNMPVLVRLYLTSNSIVDISSLAGFTSLKNLQLTNNPVVDLTALTGLTNLTDLYLSETDIVDLAPLVSNSGLGTGDNLWIQDCASLSTASVNTHIPALEARGVTVHQ